jgi:hypothetical protein
MSLLEGIRFGNIGEFKNRLLANGRKFKPAIQDAMVEVLNESVNIAKETAPVDTGFMRDHIYGLIISQTSCQMISQAPYSLFVNFGHFTRGGTFVEAQPFFSIGVEHFTQNITQRVLEKLITAGAFIL